MLVSKIDSPYDQEKAIQAIVEAFNELGDRAAQFIVAYGDERRTVFLVGPSLTELFRRLVDECVEARQPIRFCFGLRIPGAGVGGGSGFLDAQADTGAFTGVWGSTQEAVAFVERMVMAMEDEIGAYGPTLPSIQA